MTLVYWFLSFVFPLVIFLGGILDLFGKKP